MEKANKKKFFVIDAMAMVFRNYYAFGQRPLSTSEGFPTSALYGSAAFMMRLVEKEKPDYLVVASDTKKPTFRHKIYSEYKANRTDMPEDLAQQIEPFFDMLRSMGCRMLKEEGVEADDLIASLADQYASDDVHLYIVSGDKDFMQLMNKNISLYSPKKGGKVEIYGPEEVFTKFSCHPHQVIDFLSLTGDSADNVPGVAGIGLKGAAKLISDYGSLENIFENLDSVKNKRQKTALKENKDSAFLSKQLVTLKHDLETIPSLESALFSDSSFAFNENLEKFFRKYELTSLLNRMLLNRKEIVKESSTIQEAHKEIPEETVSSQGVEQELVIVKDKDSFSLLKKNLQSQEFFSFDTETTGLDITVDKPIGVSFSCKNGPGFYLVLEEEKLDEGLNREEILAFLKDLFSDRAHLKIAHNLKFDRSMLLNMGVSVLEPVADTMLMSFVLDPTRSHSLDNLSKSQLGIEKIKIKDLFKNFKTKKMEEVPLEEIARYAVEDSDCCLKLYEKFEGELKKEGLFHIYKDIEIPFSLVLESMERKGVLLDLEHLKNLSGYLEEKTLGLEKEIYELSGEEFNIASPKQLQVILYEKLKVHEKLGITKLKKTKTGFSTDVSMLDLLSEEPIVGKILEYRSLTKLKSTYVDALPKQVSSTTGRVHTSFHQAGTGTGRLSSSDPNLQNIPIRSTLGQKVREAFIAKEGYELISADYSQVELRVMAHFAREDVLQKAFTEKKDIHAITASKVFGIEESLVDSTQRSQAKAINFGILYGMGARKLAQSTGFSFSEAKSFIEGYFESFPKVKEMLCKLEDSAEELGYAETLSGRRRALPGLKSSQAREQALARNMSINTPIQGSAADLIKTAMLNLYEKLKFSRLRCDLLLQIHDELVFECHKDDLEPAMDLIKKEMETAWKLYVPLEVSIQAAKNWAEAH